MAEDSTLSPWCPQLTRMIHCNPWPLLGSRSG